MRANPNEVLAAWLTRGELVRAADLAQAWSLAEADVLSMLARRELFAATVGGKPAFPVEFAQMQPCDCARLATALGSLTAAEKLLFVKRRHGALEDRTVAEALTDDALVSRDDVFALAADWPAECGVQ